MESHRQIGLGVLLREVLGEAGLIIVVGVIIDGVLLYLLIRQEEDALLMRLEGGEHRELLLFYQTCPLPRLELAPLLGNVLIEACVSETLLYLLWFNR